MNSEPVPQTSHRHAKARYIMIGGFLGSGKTTAISRLAKSLSAQPLRVGLITNDQGQNLVDTAMLRAQGYATAEIAGGCFCCRFNSLVDAAAQLTEQTRPEVFIAEPVGSCTDLIATVTYPLRRLYGENFTIAPVSILVDPIRARRVFGLDRGLGFSEKVLYVYKKQLEEADLVVINKCDLLDSPQLESLRGALLERYPGKELISVSARHGTNLQEWFSRILREEQRPRATMEVDYDLYAAGEAMLGWLNCTVQLASPQAFDGNYFVSTLAGSVQSLLNRNHTCVAHLKMTLSPDSRLGELAVVNLVRNDFVPELSMRLEEPLKSGDLILNLRAEAAPELLAKCVKEALAEATRKFSALESKLEHLECFRPARPLPTHRADKMV